MVTDRGICEVPVLDFMVSLKNNCAVVLSVGHQSKSLVHYNGEVTIVPTDIAIGFFTESAVPASRIPSDVYSDLKRLGCIATK